MQHVFADQDRRTTDFAMERREAPTSREVALFVEHAVGREVSFAMNGLYVA